MPKEDEIIDNIILGAESEHAVPVMQENTSGKYRHEIKLLLTKAEYVTARTRISALMKPDSHSMQNGDYFIRSLYFDDIYKSSYWDKIAGVTHRKKFRLRTYNFSSDVIRLECKEKNGDRIRKTGTDISLDCAKALIAGDCSLLKPDDSFTAAEFLTLWGGKGLRPSVVVDYIREAYVEPIGNVRITFDKALRAGLTSVDMFDEELLTVPVYPHGMVIMEVKYDDFIPKALSMLVSSVGGEKIAVSKFTTCRDAVNNYKPQAISL
ncbi:MAG: polyphosphate polymerase domain-containing protein [Oscillospiraceae bacterium]|nr:polyphosphate polymerase domain-containing protein [Oscillospiraceae bacterium]